MTTLAEQRRAARERTLGLLYEAEAKGRSGREVLAELPVPADEFTASVVEAVDVHREAIDDLLERFARGWSLGRMPALDRAALRMGVAELIARPDVPTGVVLAEVVDLASRFSTDGSGRFVNGLLARVATEVREGSASSATDAAAEPLGDSGPLVDALIIDLDGVIRHWDAHHHGQAEERLGLPTGSLETAAFVPERLDRVIDGRLRFEEWCTEVGEELAAAHDVDPAAVAEAWAVSPWQVDLAVLEVVGLVRLRVPVCLLSNASTHLRRDLELSDIADQFDAIVGSADIGAAKPSREAFEAAAGAVGARLDRCLFVDDTQGHVDGAIALGMRAATFTDVEGLRAVLRDLQLLP